MKVIFDKDSEKYDYGIAIAKQFFKKTPAEEMEYNNSMLEQLRDEFVRLGRSPGYHLSAIGTPDASGWDGGFCLHEEDGYWLVYHSERGTRSVPEIFSNIQNAANYFLWIHVAHPGNNNTDVGQLPRIDK